MTASQTEVTEYTCNPVRCWQLAIGNRDPLSSGGCPSARETPLSLRRQSALVCAYVICEHVNLLFQSVQHREKPFSMGAVAAYCPWLEQKAGHSTFLNAIKPLFCHKLSFDRRAAPQAHIPGYGQTVTGETRDLACSFCSACRHSAMASASASSDGRGAAPVPVTGATSGAGSSRKLQPAPEHPYAWYLT